MGFDLATETAAAAAATEAEAVVPSEEAIFDYNPKLCSSCLPSVCVFVREKGNVGM